jgi:superfamily II DNA or RNA helicase
MKISLPSVERLLYSKNDNYIWQYFNQPGKEVDDFTILTKDPFVIQIEESKYFLTSNENAEIPAEYDFALLASKKLTKRAFETESIKIRRWLKHPDFIDLTPNEIITSWKDNFRFIKEDTENQIDGLRPPQIGALYSILAHVQNPEDRAIVVMPTGTGKTEVMLSALISNQCNKLLVAVPSDSLRTQLSRKFISLGLLKQFGIVAEAAHNPIVGIMNSKFSQQEDIIDFISKINVMVTTMSILTGYNEEHKQIISEGFSHFFIDEAHHSEAATWKNLIEKFGKEKVFLFTATPFRTDEKRLKGKFIFNFSLRNAQEQKYYKKINYLPIREYDPKKADEKIAIKAVEQLRKDIVAGHNHIIMARCATKARAIDVFNFYRQFEDLNPVVVYTGVPGLSQKIKDIKDKKHSIIVCVDMLGEGFDLPELKIAAIHDERQSIPITLQFVGRFTRTSYSQLGEASFIANLAYPPIQSELDRLYAKDTDWNLLLPKMSEAATAKEINFKEFLDGFSDLEDSVIPFQSIKPAMSTVVYVNGKNEWSPNNWKEGIGSLESYAHQYSDHNPHKNTLVIILGKISKVDWGDFDTVQNMEWDMIVVIWDLRPSINRIFINSSIKDLKTDKLVKAIFGEENSMIKGMDVFRIFNEVKRLSVYNFGGKKGIGRDITFQSFFGRGVQDGLKLLEQGTLIKNNIFGLGYKEGEKVTLGCSVRGKIWSYLRGNLSELTDWCKEIGGIVTDASIDPNTVLKHTLFPKIVIERPQVTPIAIEWHQTMFKHPEYGYEISINGHTYDLSNSELNVVDVANDAPLRFSFDTSEDSVVFEVELGQNLVDDKHEPFYLIRKVSATEATISYGRTLNQNLEEYFQTFTPTFWFADGSLLYQNSYVQLKEQVSHIPAENIIEDMWTGVSIEKESQGIHPYIQDSIQYYFISKIIDDFEIIYDDDGKGEIADIIGINNFDTYIDIHLYHLKFARNGAIGNNIENLYQVCGQAQKSLNWKHRQGKEFFEHLLKRVTKSENGADCSRLIKGTEDDLETLLSSAKWTKEMRFHIYIGQPGFRKTNASNDILLLLGNTYHYLHTVGNVELKVYSS